MLLVEDSPGDARLMAELLRGASVFDLWHADRLAVALAAWGQEPFDAVLLDLGLPDSDGLSTLVRLLEAAPEAAIVVVTGHDDEELAAEAMRLGAQDYVVKGRWSSELLARALRYAVERKRAARRLRDSEERYRLLFDSNPHPMWVYDEETLRFLAVNDAMVRSYGWSREELLTMNLRQIRPPEEVPAMLASVASTRAHREPRPPGSGQVWRHQRKDGSRIDVEVAATSLPFHGRNARLVLGTDVTDKRQLEARLLQSQKMEALGLLAGGIAHDFNNLLGVILGYADLLAEDLGPGHPGQPRLEQISNATRSAVGLTGQLLTFSRKQVVQPEVLDLNEAVANVERMLGRLLGETIELSTVLGSERRWVKVDRGRLDQVVLNLAVNARDAMPEGGKLLLETSDADLDAAYARSHPGVEPGPYVVLTASDTGHGMDAETTSRIFDPFFTTKVAGKGTGLGLATVYGIVQQCGGHLSVYSEPERGTTFRVFLPQVATGAAVAKPAGEATPARGWETILLVEDAAPLREMITETLSAGGYTVLEAPDPEAALALARHHPGPIHCLLTDLIMPLMNGRELAERLAAERGDVRVLYISGYTDETIGRQGVLEAGVHFLPKPFSQQALLRKLRAVLDPAER